MKYFNLIILFVASILALCYIDYRYNKDLVQVYEFNKWVIENYCHPNIVKGSKHHEQRH